RIVVLRHRSLNQLHARIVDTNELDTHSRGSTWTECLLPPPRDASHAVDDGFFVHDTYLELEQRTGCKWVRCFDEQTTAADVVGVVFDEISNGRAFVADRQVESATARVSATFLGGHDRR